MNGFRKMLGSNQGIGICGLAALAVLVAGCQADSVTNAAPPRPESEAASALVVAQQVQDALESSGRQALGIPVPDGFQALEAEAGTAAFRSTAGLRAISEFYVAVLPGHRLERYPDGIKLASQRTGATDVYLLERGEHREIYFMPELIDPPEPDAVPRTSESRLRSERPERFGSQYDWPQGPVASRDLADAIRRERQGLQEVSFSSGIYEEHYEEVGGVRRRVLTPRADADSSGPAGVTGPPLELGEGGSPRLTRSPAGGYDRGDGQRSLRATPALDSEGRPLPFRGGERYTGDVSQIPQ